MADRFTQTQNITNDESQSQLSLQALVHCWRMENPEFIAAYNHCIETEGLPLEEWRGF